MDKRIYSYSLVGLLLGFFLYDWLKGGFESALRDAPLRAGILLVLVGICWLAKRRFASKT